MAHYTVLYSMPIEGLSEWMQRPESERKEAEDKMKGEWDAWLAQHRDAIKNTIALGKTMRATKDGATTAMNGMMLSSYVEAESHEAAAAIFKSHPHLQIPGAVIEIMEARQL